MSNLNKNTFIFDSVNNILIANETLETGKINGFTDVQIIYRFQHKILFVRFIVAVYETRSNAGGSEIWVTGENANHGNWYCITHIYAILNIREPSM